MYFVEGYYVDFRKGTSITTPFYVEEGVIYHQKESKKQPFVIRGVEVESSYGPHRGADFTIEKDKWMEWFDEIQQMGANTIRASTVYNDQFYNALYEYNQDNEQPLYLLQGMQATTDEMILQTKYANHPEFFRSLKKDGKDLVDIIHGKKVLLANKHKGSGFYFRDVSPWVIGFLIGDEWNQDSIGYIDKTLEPSAPVNGKYVTTSSEATNFEKMMAKVIEHIVGYESRKYDTQRLTSVNSLFIMDPFEYKEHYSAQMGKSTTFTMDHIIPTEKMKAGLFASYAYEEIEFPYLEMIEHRELAGYPTVSSYLELLLQVHTLPVIISSVGYPSTSYVNHENKQETILLNDLRTFDSIGYNGAIIRSWQDVWDRRTFETSYAVDLQQTNEWHGALTATQHFGLLGFKPYRDDEVLMEVDGKEDDWQGVPVAFQDDTTKIRMTRDHGHLYFWLEDKSIAKQEPFYFALDTHPALGSQTSDLLETTFDRKMDFIVKVEPVLGASVYVQDRYQSIRENFLEVATGENPFEKYPERDSNVFEITYYLKDEKRIQTEEELLDFSIKYYRYVFEPMNKLGMFQDEQKVEADVAVEDGYAEIRIPYQLLNIYDPLKFTIHDDYYEHYGVEPLGIDSMYLSVVEENRAATQSVEIPIRRLDSLKHVEEYLKPTYEVVKNYWKEGN